MMWTLLAYSPADGWAIVKSRDKLSILRPPYTSRNLSNTSDSIVQKLSTDPDFISLSVAKDFESLGQLIAFLNHEIANWRANHGKALPEVGLGKELLARAPREVLVGFIAKVETELINSNRLDAAEGALVSFLETPTVVKDNALCLRAVSLLKSIRERRNRRFKLLEITDVSRYPLACAHYGAPPLENFVADVSSRGSLFAFAKIRG
jgi:hypothetical protein